jgi:hypothetical protein
VSDSVLLSFAGLWPLPGIALLVRYGRRARAGIQDALRVVRVARPNRLRLDQLTARLDPGNRLARAGNCPEPRHLRGIEGYGAGPRLLAGENMIGVTEERSLPEAVFAPAPRESTNRA